MKKLLSILSVLTITGTSLPTAVACKKPINETTPETTPKIKPETTPETTPKIKPETTPETTPKTKPATTPETTPKTKPEKQNIGN